MYMLTQEMEEVCRDLLLRLSDKLVSGKRSGSHLAPTLGFFFERMPWIRKRNGKTIKPLRAEKNQINLVPESSRHLGCRDKASLENSLMKW